MTDKSTEMVVAALRLAIAEQHAGESPQDHERRLANALRGVFEAKPIAYDEELYPAAVKTLVPAVAGEPEPEPLDQAALRRALAAEVADAALGPVSQALQPLIRSWLGTTLRRRGLAMGLDEGSDLEAGFTPAGLITEGALLRLEEGVRSWADHDLRHAMAGTLLAFALEGAVFHRAQRKHESLRVRVY